MRFDRCCYSVVFSILLVSPAYAQQQDSTDEASPSTAAANEDVLVKGSAASSMASSHGSGSAFVDNAGAFNYSISIAVPPNVKGMVPSLSLADNSLIKNGLVGVGWSLTGLPVIHRVNTGTGINYDGHDDYTINYSGWGAPDDPLLRLVSVGRNPRPPADEER